jgi:TRAP-type C4-dicarboxylate transport system substrate-binding protein
VELSFSLMTPLEVGSVQELLMPMINHLEEASNGRLKIVLYPGGQIAPPPELFDATREGVCDMADFGVGMIGSRFPLHCVALLPLLYPQPASRPAAATLKALYEKYPELTAEFEGVKILGFTCTGGGHVHTVNEPIHTLEDWKGKVMLGTSPFAADSIAALGGTAEMLPPPEIYDALAKGVIDGNIVEYEGLFTWHHNEAMKYTTEAGLFLNTNAWILNEAKWKSLPADLQKLLSDEVQSYCAVYGPHFDKTDARNRDMLEKQYADADLPSIYILPDEERARWIEVLLPVRDAWVQDAEAHGAPGQAILEDLLQFAQQYSYENWPLGDEYEATLRDWNSPAVQ